MKRTTPPTSEDGLSKRSAILSNPPTRRCSQTWVFWVAVKNKPAYQTGPPCSGDDAPPSPHPSNKNPSDQKNPRWPHSQNVVTPSPTNKHHATSKTGKSDPAVPPPPKTKKKTTDPSSAPPAAPKISAPAPKTTETARNAPPNSTRFASPTNSPSACPTSTSPSTRIHTVPSRGVWRWNQSRMSCVRVTIIGIIVSFIMSLRIV